MKLSSVLNTLKARPLTHKAEADLAGCYISDLLSDVLAHASPGMLWVTIQIHRNVISCALAKDIGTVLFTCGRKPDRAVVAEAEAEGIVLLSTEQTTYEAARQTLEGRIAMNQKTVSETARIAAMETSHPSGDPRFADLDRTIESYNHESTALIQVLHAAQQMFGHLGADVLRYIAGALKLPVSHVYGVVTFYNFFTMVPRGKHQIMVCRGTGCHVRGSDQILAAMEKQLGVKEGETTRDGRFSLSTARCIGACALAPAMSVGDDVYGKLTADKIPLLFKTDLKKYV